MPLFVSFSVNKAVFRYFTGHLQCRIPWKELTSSNQHLRACNTSKDLLNYSLLILKLRDMSPLEMLAETECTVPCETLNYKLVSKTLETNVTGASGTQSLLIRVENGKMPVRKETLLYTFDNFVADIGGYLGLLLGQSLLTIHDMTKGVVFKWRKRS